MRPIRLEMTAFGSYAEKTCISFDEFHHGLYLITGDTGAGKTTIFDGIMFALYGQASGIPGDDAAKKQVGEFRTLDMMHSDYAGTYDKTVLNFVFEQDGRQHTIERTYRLRQPRKGRDEASATPEYTVTLKEEGKDPINKEREVTSRINELLGMSADQFRKIIMLAQGDFSKFLSADGSVKQKILGDLFGDSLYHYYQNLIASSRDALKKERAESEAEIVRELGKLTFPKDMSEEEKIRYHAGHTELLSNLEQLIEKDREHLSQQNQLLNLKEAEKSKLDAESGTARMKNDRLSELSGKQARLSELAARQQDMEKLQVTLSLFEKAYREVLPAGQQAQKAQKAVDDLKQQENLLRKNLEEKQLILRQCEADASGNEEKQKKIEELNAEVDRVSKSEPDYKKRESAKKQLSVAEKQRKLSAEREAELQKQLQTLQDSLEKTKAETEALLHADTELVQAQHRLETAKQAVYKLTGPRQIADQVKEIRQREKKKEKAEVLFLQITRQADALSNQYLKQYRAFINGQAGILADSVRNELEEKGRATCPVCRTNLIRGCATLAPRQAETPNEQEVNQAKKEWDEAEQNRISQKEHLARIDADLTARKEAALKAVREFLPECDSWEQISDDNYAILHTLKTRLEQEEEEARKQNTHAEEKAALHKQKQSELQALGQKKEKTEEEQRQLSAEKAALDLQIAEWRNTIQLLSEKLVFPTWNEARDYGNLKFSEKRKLKAELDRINQNLSQAGQEVSVLLGRLHAAEEQLPLLEKESEAALEQQKAIMLANGFPDMTSVQNALLPAGNTDGKTWIRDTTDRLHAFETEKKSTEDAVKQLATETASYSYTNMEELQAKIDQAQKEKLSALDARQAADRILENHTNVYRAVQKAKRDLADTDQAWEMLNDLADVAAGVSGEGGKYDFDAYVMGAMFREILERANQRLSIMSGGKYELIDEVVGKKRKNSVASMEISVLDMATGKMRKSASLSGGEKFLTSLALALGLSDVVQSHTGGVSLDALFIDEGFGTLDNTALDKAITVLDQLTDGNRQVGIISHVSKLEESIPQQIRVKRGEHGSTIEIRK